ncbi:MAG: hypothetical protein KC478_15060, partial [Bacteriovoracaceae bacterium]|nr:hypothetical protein [Bacteriovoracaceae bacterium]
MKYLILLLSFSLPVFANLEAVNCSSILTKNGCSAYNGFFIGEEGSKFRVCQIKTNGYKVTIRKPKKSNPDGDQCNYNVTPKGFESESPEDNRHYSLADSGSFGVHVSFPSKMPKGSGLSRTTGAKSFYFLPKKQENKLLIDPESNELAFELQNGSRIYFNPKTGLIDEDLTTDFDVEQTPIKANSAGVIIKNPKRVMLTFPYQTGSAPTSNRNIDLVVEKEGLGCRIKAKKFFNYEFSCSQNAPCNCGPGQSYCTATAEESVGFRRSSIDGIELKEYSLEDQNQILSYNGCSKIQMANEETSDQLLTSEIVKKEVVTPSKVVDREPVKIEKKSENNSKELNVLKVPRANPVHAQSAKFIGGNLVVDEDVLYNNVSHPPLIKKEEATSSGRPHSAKFIGKNLFVDEDVLFNNISQLPEIKELSYKTSLVLPRVLELMEPEGVEVKPAVVEDPSDSQLEQGQKEVQDDHAQALKRSVAGNQCQQRVVEFFGDEANKDLVNNYIKIQSKI